MKRKNTLVDFEKTIYNNITENEIVAKCSCRLQLEKLNLNNEDIHKIIKKRFKFISKNGRFEVFGKSKCLKEDKFNETLGQHIAETRAQFKAYSIAERVFETIKKNYFLKTVKILNKAQRNCTINMVNNIEHKNDLINT
ncbi:MAG: hypothetical protein J1F35_08715 [Erysipelotrichales bacterium]|nr:hypothetical protein [Erysipelotrichales bacterium]